MTVKTVKKNFMDAFGGSLRILKDGKLADDGATMASLKAEGCKGGELELKGNTKVAGMKKKIADLYGISVVVYAADGKKPVDDGLTLASIGAPQAAFPAEKPAEKKEPKEKPAKEPKEKPEQKAASAQPTAAGFSFNELLNAALADGVLTDKERAILLKKATAQGLDPDEVEMIIEGRLAKKMRMQPKVEKKNEEKKKTHSSDTNNSISDHNREQLMKIKATTGYKQTQMQDHNREQLERIKALRKTSEKPIQQKQPVPTKQSTTTETKQSLMEKAEKCLKIGDDKEAIKIYKKIIMDYDEAWECYEKLFIIYEKKSDYKEAIKFGTLWADARWERPGSWRDVVKLIENMFDEMLTSNRKRDASRLLDTYGKYIDHYAYKAYGSIWYHFNANSLRKKLN